MDSMLFLYCLFIVVVYPISLFLDARKREIRSTSSPYDYFLNLIIYLIIILVLFSSPLEWVNSNRASQVIVYLLILSTVSFGIVLLFYPFMKKHYHATVYSSLFLLPCAAFIINLKASDYDQLLVIYVPRALRAVSIAHIWLVGFLAVILWHVVSHLLYRRKILKDALVIADSNVSNIWVNELEQYTEHDIYCTFYLSDHVKTPLTVGLFRRTLCIVLPNRPYSSTELSMIMRHEIVHILRRDYALKFKMGIINALLWFNPLVWICMKKNAESMEMSCDEMVLSGANEDYRRQYAKLLLTTASSSRGFTTCLSSSAKDLKFRLEKVLRPAAKATGCLVLALVSGILLFFAANTTFCYNYGALGADIMGSGKAETYTVTEVEYGYPSLIADQYSPMDETALLRHLLSAKATQTAEYPDLDIPYVHISLSTNARIYDLFFDQTDLHYYETGLDGEQIEWLYMQFDSPMDIEYVLSLCKLEEAKYSAPNQP